MLDTTSAYKAKVRDRERSWDIKGTITPLTGSAVTIGKADLELGGLKVVESVIGSGKLTLGGGIMGDISATLINSTGKFNGVNLSGAKFRPEVRLEKSDGTFFDWIPLGVFNIDEVRDSVTSIGIKGFDNLVFFDRPFSELSITFPQTAKQLLGSICAQVGVAFKTSTFTNESYIPAVPVDELTCREMLVHIGQLAGGWVRCDREGKIEVVSIRKPSNSIKDFEITPGDRYSFKADEPTVITGVTLETGDDTYLSGTDTYTIDLGPNPLFSASIQTTLNNIKNKVNSLSYSAIECEWIGDPAIQAGDIVKNTDRGGKAHYSFVGSTSYAFRGSGRITCGSVSDITSKYVNPTQRALKSVKLVSGQQTETNNKMDSLEQAVNSATNLLVNANGLYKHEVNGVLYFSDGPNLQTSQKVWTFGSEGFGFSSTGWQGTYYTSITADNSITANTITASMIKTGLLQSLNGKSSLNLDNGTFNLGDGALTWNGATLLTKGDFIAEGNTSKGVLLSAYGEFYDIASREMQGLFFTEKSKDIANWKKTDETNTLDSDMNAGFYYHTLSVLGETTHVAEMYGKDVAQVEGEDMVQLYSEGDVYINCGFGSSDGIYLQGNVSSLGNFTLVDGKFLMTSGGGATKRLIGIDENRNVVVGGASAPGNTYIYTKSGGQVYFYIGGTQVCSIRSNGIYNSSNQRVVDFTKVV